MSLRRSLGVGGEDGSESVLDGLDRLYLNVILVLEADRVSPIPLDTICQSLIVKQRRAKVVLGRGRAHEELERVGHG